MTTTNYELLITEQYTSFSFQSIGNRGIFEKRISFHSKDDDIFDLSLIDYNVDTNKEDDLSRTSNGDLPRIIATVTKAILLFLKRHPMKIVRFTGSTESRTRLYQIHINKVYPSLSHNFIVLGQKGQSWHEVKVNILFEAFIIAKKDSNLVW